jgi:hypothetical protein
MKGRGRADSKGKGITILIDSGPPVTSFTNRPPVPKVHTAVNHINHYSQPVRVYGISTRLIYSIRTAIIFIFYFSVDTR